jgi:hypothetical protein
MRTDAGLGFKEIEGRQPTGNRVESWLQGPVDGTHARTVNDDRLDPGRTETNGTPGNRLPVPRFAPA